MGLCKGCTWGPSGKAANCSSGETKCNICRGAASIKDAYEKGGIPRRGIMTTIRRIISEGPEDRINKLWEIVGPLSNTLKEMVGKESAAKNKD